MTDIERKLRHAKWVNLDGMTTVCCGLGFIIYQKNGKMWLACYSKEVVAKRRKIHSTEDPNEFVTYGSLPIDCLFNIPASDGLVEAAIRSIYPDVDDWCTE